MPQIKRLVSRAFDIREGEHRRLTLMFSYLMVVIACLVISKPVRDSTFLKKLGPEQLPYVYVLIAVVVGFITSIYSRAVTKTTLNQLIRVTSLILIINLFVFWWLLRFHWGGGWLVYVFYIWVDIFGIITTSQFWLLANYVFNPREARRLFPLIGAGGLLGGVLGASFTTYGAVRFGTENLLLWCIGFMILLPMLGELIWGEVAEVTGEEPTPRKRFEAEGTGEKTGRMLRLIWRSRHLTMLTAILIVAAIAEAFIDYEVKVVSNSKIASRDELTVFFGSLYASSGIFSLLFQMFVTTRILKRFGIGSSLLFLPISLLAGSTVLAISPSLWAASFLKVSDASFKNSVHRSGMELLYLPIPLEVKNRVKGFIDMFVDRFGGGLAGLMLLVFISLLGMTINHLSLLVCVLILAWIVLSLTAKKQYLNSFRLALEKKTIEPEALRVRVSDSSTVQALIDTLNSQDERHVLLSLSLLRDFGSETWKSHLGNLLAHPSASVRAFTIECLRDVVPSEAVTTKAVHRCLHDPDLKVRTEAVYYLSMEEGEPSLQKIGAFLEAKDYDTAGAAVECLLKYRLAGDGFIDEPFINRALAEAGEQREKARLCAASALSLLPSSSQLQPYLILLLDDPSPAVVRGALQSAGRLKRTELVPHLVRRLAQPALRPAAREALVMYGAPILGMLSSAMRDPELPIPVRANLPKVFSMMGSQEAASILIENVSSPNPFLAYRVIKALNRMRVNYPALAFQQETIDSLVVKELKNYYQFGQMLRMLDTSPSGRNQATQLLQKALHEKMDQLLEKVFRLLGLRYPPKDMVSAFAGIRSGKAITRASAIEFLDNILRPGLKEILLPLLEQSSAGMLPGKANRLLGTAPASLEAHLEQLISTKDTWLKTLAIYVTGSLGLKTLLPRLRQEGPSVEPATLQILQWSLARLEGL